MDSMFVPLTEQEKIARIKLEDCKDKVTAIIPVPDDVELIIPSHTLGVPQIVWNYRDKEGSLLYGLDWPEYFSCYLSNQ